MITIDPDRQKLDALGDHAYRLGMIFGAEAERALDPSRQTEFFQLFDRCFTALRLSIALKLRLNRPAPALRAEVARETPADPSEREGSARYYDRDRDRESEPASLPLLLKTLNGVVADAARLPGPEAAVLPGLRDLLAAIASAPKPVTPIPVTPIPVTPKPVTPKPVTPKPVTPKPVTSAPATLVRAAAPPGAGLRARLASSTTAPVLTLQPLPGPALRGALPLRPATGPPRR